jgi:hypothetical protein
MHKTSPETADSDGHVKSESPHSCPLWRLDHTSLNFKEKDNHRMPPQYRDKIDSKMHENTQEKRRKEIPIPYPTLPVPEIHLTPEPPRMSTFNSNQTQH